MSALFEIVPNLSEGRDATTIDAAVAAAETGGARVVHRTSDAVHHRSVLTIVGSENQVLAAAVALAGIAVERIDLRAHRGVHPRIGALDVLPFVPLRDATMAQAVELARKAAGDIWRQHRVPSFFYGEAATVPHRRQLADVRRGQYEELDVRFEGGDRPDTGDIARHAGAGAIAIGARPVLIAFNVDLATGDLDVAIAIARQIRERDGGMRTLRALGLRLSPGRVQVSLNLTDYHATPLYRVVETIRILAAERGTAIANSELIGCLPLDAVEDAARFYLGVIDN
jgi:glutamate formiminotransferase